MNRSILSYLTHVFCCVYFILLLQTQNIIICMILMNLQLFYQFPPLPKKYWKLYLSNFGTGKGKIKSVRCKHCITDIYSLFSNIPSAIEQSTGFPIQLWQQVLHHCRQIKNEVFQQSKIAAGTINIENRLFLTLRWIREYNTFSLYAMEMGSSTFVIATIITEMIPFILEFMIRFIPNRRINDSHSIMNRHIGFIIDGTLSKIYKPKYQQHLYYNSVKCIHAINSLLLIDFEGFIVAVATGVPGSIHDCLYARNVELFRQICRDSNCFALGDPGFQGAPFVVGGFRCNQIKTNGHVLFDYISRKEQICIEHINSHFKRCRSVSKHVQFRHDHATHKACILIACGLYNWKRQNGFYR